MVYCLCSTIMKHVVLVCLALSHIHAPDHVITRTSFSSKEDAILFVLKTMPQARKYEKDFFRDNDFDVPDGIIERWIDR